MVQKVYAPCKLCGFCVTAPPSGLACVLQRVKSFFGDLRGHIYLEFSFKN